MLAGASIICFAHDWSGDPTSKTHIMRILSQQNRILWVNSIGMRRPSASGRDVRRLVAKFRQGLQGCTQVRDNLFVWNPLTLPLPGVPGVDAFNTWLLSAALRTLARRLAMPHPLLLWTFLPNVNRLVGRLGEDLVIYHCVDEYSAFSGVPQAALQQMEGDLVRKADVVFTSSEQLCQERQVHNPRTFFISHGVDVPHFARALDPGTAIPADIQPLPRPIIGFFGLLADWIDLALIRSLAHARPQWSIVLVGKATADISAVQGVPNIHVLGQKPYEALPGYCRAFDVGIIPFQINALTLRANPLKMREYLAAGLPVVSTDMPEVRKYQELVRLASRPDTFLREVEAALAENGAGAQQRIDAMRAESWEARVEQLSSVIKKHLL